MYQVKSPILFLIFNRPKETQILFNAIKEAKPNKLYVAADGPRNNGKDELVCKVVKDILKQIDWDCELITLFRKENLGCGRAVSSAITWFFENEKEGIILEDDCLPSSDFFRFCDSMLEKYREDSRIGHICGTNFQDGIKRGKGDYYYSSLVNVWGWASWRRVWQNYDFDMINLETAYDYSFLDKVNRNNVIQKFIYQTFQNTKKGLIDTWDYQYFYSNLVQSYISIIPNYNMISNIGFSGEATHTVDLNSPFANMKVNNLPSNVISPAIFVPDIEADQYSYGKSLPNKFVIYYWFLKQFIKSLFVKKQNKNK